MIISNSKKSLDDIFNKKLFYRVPKYQRGFSWGKEQIESLWNDILENYEKKEEEEYFLGTILLKEERKKPGHILYEIIDGQQRLAVMTIFYCCLRDHSTLLGDMSAQKHIQDLILVKGRKGDSFKIQLNKLDHVFFKTYIQMPDMGITERKKFRIRGKPESNKLIKEAYEYFYKKIDERLQSFEDMDSKKKEIYNLATYTSNQFILLSIVVEDSADAYVIFETLNDRGLDLSINDLLKNFLLSRATKDRLGNNEIEKLNDDWEEMTASLGEKNSRIF